jgi:subtilase family protein/VCBS repeat protein
MRRRNRRLTAVAILCAALGLTALAPTAFAAFPYTRPAGNPHDFNDLYLGAGQTPNDLSGDGNLFKFAATPDPSNGPQINQNPVELNGVRGAHIDDSSPSARTAWMTTTGRPDVAIAVLDSGIKWNDAGAMDDLRLKVRLNKGELPIPEKADATPCGAYDCNGDGVFNVGDYANDPRVNLGDPRRVGPPGVITPQDLIIAFSDGSDGDSNGFVDDIAGWDFLDNDNDPFDDVQYGHGTGEANDSSSEADNGGQAGSCPNCMVLPLRVGDSFIADDNRFAQATLYATDNGIDVVQEALGTLNNSSLARQAVDYAYRHGVTVISSAADEAAQHNNWPSSLPHVILVNSVTTGAVPPPNQSYLSFNGCTNFNSKITLAIPSTSCSSNATGLAAGMAGLVYSAALDAKAKGALKGYPDPAHCKRVNGNPCVITPNEVRQVMATGAIGAVRQADDVNFAGAPPQGGEPSCSPAPAPGCTDPGGAGGALQAQVDANRQAPIGPPALFRSYPARKGPDQFYGYGRVNMAKALTAVLASHDPNPPRSRIPPEAEITSPQWYEQVNPARPTLDVEGQVFARGSSYICEVLVAPGQYPNNARTTANAPGDFAPLRNGWCNGNRSRRRDHSGPLARISISELRSRFPAATNFNGPEPQASPGNDNGRPNAAPHAFTIKLVVRTANRRPTLAGRDQRAAYLKRDQGLLPGFPKGISRGAITAGFPTSDGESSPVLADLNGDNRNELIVAGSDGFVHALRPDGTELAGWPVRGDRPPLHTGERAFRSGEVSSDVGGAILGSIAVADANGDGAPEVYADDLEGKVYGWSATGRRTFTAQANPRFSGKPLQPFVNARHGETNRTQHGFVASPVLADLDGDGKQEIIAAGMDRHLYAWHPNGNPVAGFPVLVVDPTKVQSIDPQTHQVTFKPSSGSFQQGAIIDTPAVADLNGDGKPEIVLGTNEEYAASQDGGWNAAPANGASFNLLDQLGQGIDQFKSACGSPCDDIPGPPLKPANSRLYAIHPDGNAHGDPFVSGWPAKVAVVDAELLPVVGEGITGYPIVGKVNCGSGGGPKVGAMANNGLAYVFGPNGQSCYGRSNGADIPLQTDGYGNQPDHPLVPAVGLPAFSDLDGTGLSFIAPAAGLGRALDVAFPDYQPTGQDFLAAWSVPGGGQLRTPSFPQPVNDLQFLTGPSIADLDGAPGQEIVEGTASMDLNAFNAAGAELAGWPKLTTDWTVANPTVGSFGTLDTASAARKAVIAVTRSGYIGAYSTSAPACSPSTWPRFHHDDANSGDYARDATLPGKPFGLHSTAARITFKAPGDDLLCGGAHHYQVVTANHPIDEANFKAAHRLSGAPTPVSPGAAQSYAVPPAAMRFVAIRAVDDQGNVGRPVVADLGGAARRR